MAALLSEEQVKMSRAWLHDVFVAGGLVQQPVRNINVSEYRCMYGGYAYNGDRFKEAAKVVCDAIKFRIVETKKMQELDSALDTLANYAFVPDLHSTNRYDRGIRKSADMLAKYIVNFCVENNYYWDNSSTSTYEMDEIKQTTTGRFLFESHCFTSQTAEDAANAKNGIKVPKNGYKSAGPQSGSLPNLIGKPNEKIILNNLVYCIEGDKIGKNVPNAFITPISVVPGVSTLSKAQAEKVKVGSGNGYTDCKCWFADANVAQDFLVKCKAKLEAQAKTKFTNLHVAQAKADKNGYFQVSTEFGINTYIKASRLNEEVLEKYKKELQEEYVKKCTITVPFKTYEEGFYKD